MAIAACSTRREGNTCREIERPEEGDSFGAMMDVRNARGDFSPILIRINRENKDEAGRIVAPSHAIAVTWFGLIAVYVQTRGAIPDWEEKLRPPGASFAARSMQCLLPHLGIVKLTEGHKSVRVAICSYVLCILSVQEACVYRKPPTTWFANNWPDRPPPPPFPLFSHRVGLMGHCGGRGRLVANFGGKESVLFELFSLTTKVGYTLRAPVIKARVSVGKNNPMKKCARVMKQ